MRQAQNRGNLRRPATRSGRGRVRLSVRLPDNAITQFFSHRVSWLDTDHRQPAPSAATQRTLEAPAPTPPPSLPDACLDTSASPHFIVGIAIERASLEASFQLDVTVFHCV